MQILTKTTHTLCKIQAKHIYDLYHCMPNPVTLLILYNNSGVGHNNETQMMCSIFELNTYSVAGLLLCFHWDKVVVILHVDMFDGELMNLELHL